MTTLKLNDAQFPLTAFTRNTFYNGEALNSVGYCTLGHVENRADLYTLCNTKISVFQLLKNDEIIYDAGEINARVSSIDENLVDESKVDVSISIQF